MIRTIFPDSFPVIDKLIISYLSSVEDHVNLSMVNGRAYTLLSNAHFKNMFYREIKNLPGDVQKSIEYSLPEVAITHEFWWQDHGRAIKLNRGIQQIIAAHPTLCYKLLCRVLFCKKTNFKIPESKEKIIELHADFVPNAKREKELLQEKLSYIGDSLIDKLKLDQKTTQEKIKQYEEGNKEKFEEADDYMRSYECDVEIQTLNGEAEDILNNILIPTSIKYEKIQDMHKEYEKEVELVFKKNFEIINEKFYGEKQEVHTFATKVIMENMSWHRLQSTYYYNIVATEKITKSLLDSLDTACLESTVTFVQSHRWLLENLKSLFRMLECKDCMDEMLVNKYCGYNPKFIIKQDKIDRIKFLINDSPNREFLWKTLWQTCANGDTSDPSWAENNFPQFLKALRNLIGETIYSYFEDFQTAYTIKK